MAPPLPAWIQGSLDTHLPSCPLCESPPDAVLSIENALYRTRDGFFTASIAHNICPNDAFCYMSPRPTPAALQRYYTRSIEPVFDQNASVQRVRCDLLVEFLKRHPSASADRRILDIGCNDGALLAQFLEQGYEAVGIEPSLASAAHCRSNHPKIEVHAEPFEIAVERCRDRHFELVTLVHVLEHLSNFHEILTEIHSLDFSWLFIEVPNALGGLYPRIMKEFGHLYFFSESTLTRSVEQAGFRTVFTRSRENGQDLPSLQMIAERADVSNPANIARLPDIADEAERLRNELAGISTRWGRERAALRNRIEALVREGLSERVALFGAGTDALFFLQIPEIAARTACIVDSNPLTRATRFVERYPVVSLEEAVRSGIREILVTPRGREDALCAALRAQVPASVRVISCYE